MALRGPLLGRTICQNNSQSGRNHILAGMASEPQDVAAVLQILFVALSELSQIKPIKREIPRG